MGLSANLLCPLAADGRSRRAAIWRLGHLRETAVRRPSLPPCLAAAPPPPTLSVDGESAQVFLPGADITLVCVAPLSGVEFQLRRGEEVLLVPRASTSPDRIFFKLKAVAAKDGGLYTCRYRLGDERTAWPWSADSAAAELLPSDGEPALRPWGGGDTRQRSGTAGLWVGAQPQRGRPASVSQFENGTVSSAISRPSKNNWANTRVWRRPCGARRPGHPPPPPARRDAAGARALGGARDPAPRARRAGAAALPRAPGRPALRPGARGRGEAPGARPPEPPGRRGPLRAARRLAAGLGQLQLRLRGHRAALRGLGAQRARGAARGR